ncbi:MAG: N-acetyltransferase [Candidatus Omnitrophota bacterium]|nr:MAG: N-acetyltransferase [Candidatus Omnitrophota bacterium]
MKNASVHKRAIIEKCVKIGRGTKVWDNVHIREKAEIGKNCIIGGKTYIAYNVKIGNLVKINSFVYVCTGVTIKDKVMISAGTVFTNDKFPRAVRGNSEKLFTSDPTKETEETTVEEGVTIGAGAVIGCGITLGKYCMVGMGSVVTKNVLPYSLVYGVPAKIRGYVCRCGYPLGIKKNSAICNNCENRYFVSRTKSGIKVEPQKKTRK